MAKSVQHKLLLVFCLSLLLTGSLFAQGVTTGAMNGLVTDAQGEALVGANVIVVHEPSGTTYGTAVRNGGAFDIRASSRHSGSATFVITQLHRSF